MFSYLIVLILLDAHLEVLSASCYLILNKLFVGGGRPENTFLERAESLATKT